MSITKKEGYTKKLSGLLNISRYESIMNTRDLIIKTSQEVTDLLLEKNAAYGDSALNPVGIFSKGNAVDSLCARIDDKLMRIKSKGITDATEDTVQDLIGYLILLKIAIHRQYELEEERE
jgi:hypothetical protein